MLMDGGVDGAGSLVGLGLAYRASLGAFRRWQPRADKGPRAGDRIVDRHMLIDRVRDARTMRTPIPRATRRRKAHLPAD
jgi:hypothetical protein